MTDQQIPIVYMEQIEGEPTLSTDGTTALVMMSDRQGSKFGIMIAVERLATLQHVLSATRRRHTRREMAVGFVVPHEVETWVVGYPQNVRNYVAVTFDQMLPTEAVYVMTDEKGLALAEELERNILSRMTPAQRHAHARSKHPLLLPIKPQIVTP